ncbi:hypothetical protein L226DRAFT_41436 [Lentinus tigrinus ALCF2SS1-7]|uniref:F-box domain-containing protein n=1 Tax=Lentinus tigrinus ALCF2SS1-6 TaxID=1328759 RepID=A0A5C2SMS7_9APHY|nr:hypothetical protein L227DRAFT_260855 [Lentinus tigrinus ALCF2SS1-6]RPD82914.1 hypothetical protein L226DRAFT_41436 [Lentinus tigrinus ALCF2SS1-7]
MLQRVAYIIHACIGVLRRHDLDLILVNMSVALADLPPHILKSICAQSPRRDLVSVVTTCRVLSDFARQSIWRTIPCFAIMAFTLPQDLLQREITEPQPGELPSWRSVRRIWRLSFTRALAPEDLERFRMHAQYVRAVDAYSYRRSAFVLSPATWCKLERVLEQGCLPNLRSLIKDDIVSCTVEPMHIFLSDNLRHLEYRFYDLEREDQPGGGISEWVEGWVLGLLTGITHHTSDIRVFHLLINPASSALCAELFLEALPKLTSVVSFQVPNFIYTPPSALSILADFAQLHNLAIAVRCEDFRSGTPDLPQGSFPALRTLTIVSDSSSWCVAFLSKICSPHVATIFKVNMPASSDDFLGFSNTLSGHPSADVVRTLALIFDPGPTPVALPPPVITPLYTLRSMEEIRIEGGCYAALDDDAFARMVLSWPSIQIVNVCSTSSKSSYPGVTLSGLASVIEHCRNIVSLMIRLEDIDEREITALLARKPPRIFELVPAVADDPTADARLVRRPFCPLDMLGVGSSRITEAHVGGVAAVLSLWFPLLDDILYCSRFTLAEIDGGIAQDGTPLDVDTVEQNNLWREVMTMISAMATAREQEQRWQLINTCGTQSVPQAP